MAAHFPGTQLPGRSFRGQRKAQPGRRPLGFDHPGLKQFGRVARRSILISFSERKD
jgi:hypothetical protein